jgi:maltose alpha-D-glucosyltransferase/alpha-amylase
MKTKRRIHNAQPQDDPLWYKDAIIYELHVRAFADSNGDGIGDFRGLIDKLDYLEDLGVTALWLLPFYPSPLRDDGYDISNYTNVNPIYGSLADFKALRREAHRRGLRLITELVLNHTSDQHPWFQRARRSPPGSSVRDFYVWSDTIDKYKDARIIFSDFESSNWTWDPVARAYYWHRFYSHQPDLNFDNPVVLEAVLAALDFWLRLGIDGLRLDAVPYLFEREGTNCENLPETHDFLKKLRRHIDEHYRNRMLLAEANQWPEDAVAYFGTGDECNMAFHFPLMPRLFMAINMEDRFPVIDILQQTPPIPDSSQWALFLRNHDELTLEMVTDEDRDYMYRVYAQESHARINLGIRRRLAPLLENHRAKIELMKGLLFSLPGTPVIYYGDEIGMGDNIYLGDRNGVRTPMQWTAERNAGFSRANPQRLYLPVIIDPEYDYHTVNVEAQQNNPHSLLWWMKRLIGLRKRYEAFGRGSLEFLYPENHKVLAYIRRYREETVLVVANLSRFVQFAELTLSAFKGSVPVEMLGRTALPPIGDHPLLLTLAPYAFYWLALEPKSVQTLGAMGEGELPVLEVTGAWDAVFRESDREKLAAIVLRHLSAQGWSDRMEGEPKSAQIVEAIPVPSRNRTYVTLVQVEYTEGESQTYSLALAFASDSRGMSSRSGPKDGLERELTAEQVRSRFPHAAVCQIRLKNAKHDSAVRAPVSRSTESRSTGSNAVRESATASSGPSPLISDSGLLYEPLIDKTFTMELLNAMSPRRRFRGEKGALVTWTVPAFASSRGPGEQADPYLLKGHHGNTLVACGDRAVLKVFRRVEEGPHPEIELANTLATHTSFAPAAPLIGALDYRMKSGKQMTLGVLLGFVHHEGDAWRYTVDSLHRFFMQVLAHPAEGPEPELPNRPFLEVVQEDLPHVAHEFVGHYLESARLMGQRTAELHIALGSVSDVPDFAPEAFTLLYQRSLYQTARTRTLRTLDLLRARLKDLPDEVRVDGQKLLQRDSELLTFLRSILDRQITAQRIRCHGDFRLNNLLYTGKDFAIVDFEGEVFRSMSSRRRRRSPLGDVASFLSSLYFAVRTAVEVGGLRHEDMPVIEPWARFWHWWTSVAFLKSYLDKANQGTFLPKSHEEMQILLDHYFVGRCILELRQKVASHPTRSQIPLRSLLHFLDLRGSRPPKPDEVEPRGKKVPSESTSQGPETVDQCAAKPGVDKS